MQIEEKLGRQKPNLKGSGFSRFGWHVPLHCGDVGVRGLVENQHCAWRTLF